MSQNLQIPYNFKPRPYQMKFISEIEKAIDGESEKKYFYQIWHRRAGKDRTNIAVTAPRMLLKSSCLVKYVFPTLVMGRENLWDGMGSDGFRYREHIPEFIRAGKPNETTMKIPINNGSLFQIGGSDRPDSLRGGNSRMFIFSEWAEQDPYAWDVVEPILRENKGLAIFNSTPKGDNHARALYEYAKVHPNWFVQKLTVDDTGIFSADEVKQIRDDTIKRFEMNGRSADEAIAYVNQEYYCSFDAPVIGSYYGAGIQKAENEGRVLHIPQDQTLQVHTAWDLGVDDSTTIWFFQIAGLEIRFIDYYENSGEGLPHYAQILQEKKYLYGNHYAPHDIEVRELGSGKSRKEIAKGLGIDFKVAMKLHIDDGINAVRSTLSQCYFDVDKCSRGLQALRNYRKDWDEKNMVYRRGPLHDWSSHGADAFRTFAVSYKRTTNTIMSKPSNVGGIKPYFPGLI